MKSLRTRRTIAVLLALILLLGIIPYAAFADDGDSQEYENEVIETVAEAAAADEEGSAPTEAHDTEPAPDPEAPAVTENETPSEAPAEPAPGSDTEEDVIVPAEETEPAATGADEVVETEAPEQAPEETSAPAQDVEEDVQDAPKNQPEEEPTEQAESQEPIAPAEEKPSEEKGDVRNPDGSYTDSEGYTYYLISTGTKALTKVYHYYFYGIYFSGKGKSGNFPFMAIGQSYSDAVGQNGSLLYSNHGWIYCIDYMHSAGTGSYNTVSLAQAPTWNAMPTYVQRQVTFALLYGARLGNNNNHLAYVATQTILWQYQYGGRTSPTQNISSIMYSADSPSVKAQIDSYYNQILAAVAAHMKFVNLSETSHEFPGVGAEYKVKISDKNNVLQNGDWMIVNCPAGVHAEIVNGKLEVYATSEFDGSKEITLRRKTYSLCGSGVALHVGAQWSIYGVPTDPDKAVLKVTVKAPEDTPIPMTMKKTTDGDPAGYCFGFEQSYTHKTWYGISGSNGDVYVCNDDSFQSTGSTTFNDVTSGEFTFTEYLTKHGAGDVWPDMIQFKVYDQQGHPIHTLVYQGDQIKNVNGNAVVRDIPLDDLTNQGRLEITINNMVTPGSATMKKVASDGYHDGFRVHLYNSHQRYTWFGTSDEDGNIYECDEWFDPIMNGDSYSYEFKNMNDGKFFFVEHDPGLYVPEYVKFYLKPKDGPMQLVGSFTTAEIMAYTNDYVLAEPGAYYCPGLEIEGLNGGGKLIVEVKNVKPTVSTNAWVLAEPENLKTLPYNSSVQVKDIVDVTDTIAGNQYHLVVFAKDFQTGEALTDGEGNRVEAVSDSFNGAEGTIQVDTFLTVNTAGLASGEKIVLCQELWDDTVGICVDTHENIDDANQQLTVDDAPEMHTTATWQDGSKVCFDFEANEILDSVEFTDNVPTGSYVLMACLGNVDTHEIIATEYVNNVEFVYGVAHSNLTVSFDVSEMDVPVNTVVLEYLYAASDTAHENPVIVHEDWADEGQIVRTAAISIHTMAHDSSDASQKFLITGILEDEVYINVEGNIPEGEYVLIGKLMERIENEDGSFSESVLLVNDAPVTARVNVTLSGGETTATVVFPALSIEDVAGKVLVVYEDLVRPIPGSEDTTPITDHHNIEDEDQTVYVPSGRTTAADTLTESHHTYAQEEVELRDVYYYDGLIIGKEYELEAYIEVVTEDEEGNIIAEPLMVDGQQFKVSVSFVPEAKSGSVEIVVTVPALVSDGTRYVFGEDLWYENVCIQHHFDINDEEQTIIIHTPIGHTTATDAMTNSHDAYAAEEITLRDIYYYENVVTGRTYTVQAVLVYKVYDENGELTYKPVLVDENPVVLTQEFTPEETSGYVEFLVTVPGMLEDGTEFVFGEALWYNAILLHVHFDLEDAEQTVRVHTPEGHTTASDTSTNSHYGYVQAEVELRDLYYYENLIPGETYTLKAFVVSKEVDANGNAYGKVLLVNGEPVEIVHEFVAAEASGVEEVIVKVPAYVADGTSYVFGETLFYNGNVIHYHFNVEDEAQTVTLKKLKFCTTATVDGKHSVFASGIVAPVDRIDYTAIEGTTLLFKATLCERVVDKSGNVSLVPFVYNAKVIEGQTTVVVKDAEGSAMIQFPAFSANGLENRSFVVVEEAYMVKEDGTLVHLGTENNPNNKDQTISFYNNPKTGDENDLGLWIGLLAGSAVLAGACFLALTKKRKTAKTR